jgi:hypothetical protein
LDGTHIHKFAGYGLTDLVPADPRVNWASPLLRGEELTGDDYWQWLERRYPPGPSLPVSLDWSILSHNSDHQRDRELRGLAAMPADHGLPSVMAVQPAALDEWHRYNDPVDIVTEALARPGSTGSYAQQAGEGIWPFNTLWMTADGQQAKEPAPGLVPLVPEEVRDLAEYTALFTSPGTWLSLRPLLITWWD